MKAQLPERICNSFLEELNETYPEIGFLYFAVYIMSNNGAIIF